MWLNHIKETLRRFFGFVPPHSPQSAHLMGNTESKKAFFIAPETDLNLLIKVYLIRKGYRVTVVRSLEEAFEVLKTFSPNFILVDQTLCTNGEKDIQNLQAAAPGAEIKSSLEQTY